MSKSKYRFLKHIGIAGFLFFLIKGILWLLFGTAIYRWVQSVLSICVFLFLALTAVSQSQNMPPPSLSFPIFLEKTSTPSSYLQHPVDNYVEQAFFCKLENKLNPKKFQRFSFRLGNHNYCNNLEYGKYLNYGTVNLP